ncbi:hypothetical protein L1049_006964 [Liquidambar formosana]|uniref:Uncharacterized protein n=1 Tax=Liquidambar formosana TaxID=63359 RepID=A0AAP0WUE9_LIQFO
MPTSPDPPPPPPSAQSPPLGSARRGRAFGCGSSLTPQAEPRLWEAGKQASMRRTGLPARDLWMLDPFLSYPSTVLGRKRAIVINLEHIKAIMTAQEALILNFKDPSVMPFVEQLQLRIQHFHQPTKSQVEYCFQRAQRLLTLLDLHPILASMWRTVGEWRLVPLGKGYYDIHFYHAEDMRKEPCNNALAVLDKEPEKAAEQILEVADTKAINSSNDDPDNIAAIIPTIVNKEAFPNSNVVEANAFGRVGIADITKSLDNAISSGTRDGTPLNVGNLVRNIVNTGGSQNLVDSTHHAGFEDDNPFSLLLEEQVNLLLCKKVDKDNAQFKQVVSKSQ